MNNKILFVDDDYDVLSAYQRNLRKLFNISTALSGAEAINVIRDSTTYSVIVSDYKMPHMNGIEFLKQVRNISPDTVRMIITGFADIQICIDAINEGNIFRFLTKPYPTELLVSTLNSAIEQYQLVIAEKELLENTLKGSIKLLIDILSVTNPIAFNQAARLRNMARGIAQKLGIKSLWEVEIAALLSLIGCVGIPNEILEKKFKGKPLLESENNLFNSHPETGKKLLQNIPRLESIAIAIGNQFKNYDGIDNTSGVKTESKIPLISRILKVIFDYDNYIQAGLPEDTAFKYLLKDYRKYDPDVLDALEKEIKGSSLIGSTSSIPFRNLRINMILADDIIDTQDNLIVKKGTEVTDVILLQLINVAKSRTIVEPVRVISR